jgi:tetratricopeptide (TPR) repeat protein
VRDRVKGALTSRQRDRTGAALREGLAHHQAGRLPQAEACYDRALRELPGHPDALHLKGLAALMGGAVDRAIPLLARAVDARPAAPEYQLSLGNARLAAGDLAGAAAAYGRAVALAPDQAAARSNLGHVLRLGGDLDGAVRHLEHAVALAPTLADARINLGLARLDAGRVGDAIHELEQAVALAPGAAAARLNLGTALRADGRLESALARFLEAAALDPTLGAAHRNAAVCHQLLGRADEALAGYRRAVALDPQDADSLTNLGVALLRAGQVDEAMAAHDAAVAAGPLMAEAWLNRAGALQAMGRLDEAQASVERSLALAETAAARTALGSLEAELGRPEVGALEHERAIALDPQQADAHWNLALALLASGQLGRAWDQYEWRWRAANAPARWRDYPWPTWQGEPVQEKRILIWREQGLGDELMFLSAVPDLIAAGARVTVLVSGRLRSLVARSFPDATVLTDAPDAVSDADRFDYHLPMGSLPRWLRRTRNAFPASGAFLRPDPLAAARWRERLAGLGSGPTVGVCWRSGLVTAERRRFYPSLRDWAPVFATPGVRWVNLQYDDCLDELREIEGRWGVTVHRWDDVDLRNDLESVLALVASLSAVVTAPTVVSSFAGAVGTRTWQVDSGSDWTALGEPGSPWFPSIGVVRAAGSGRGWGEVLARVGSELGVWTREAAA